MPQIKSYFETRIVHFLKWSVELSYFIYTCFHQKQCIWTLISWFFRQIESELYIEKIKKKKFCPCTHFDSIQQGSCIAIAGIHKIKPVSLYDYSDLNVVF